MSEERKKARLFEYAILHHPIPEDMTKTPPPSVLLVEPTTTLAADEKGAFIVASRAIPEGFIDRLQELEIAVRPF